MSDFRASLAARQAMGDGAAALLDAAAGPGRLSIYAGAKPASPNDALTDQILLAQLELSAPAFAPADTEGQLVANPIAPDAAADASGTAAFFRLEDGAGIAVFQGDVGATGSGADLELVTTEIVAGVEVVVTSLVITVPEA